MVIMGTAVVMVVRVGDDVGDHDSDNNGENDG